MAEFQFPPRPKLVTSKSDSFLVFHPRRRSVVSALPPLFAAIRNRGRKASVEIPIIEGLLANFSLPPPDGDADADSVSREDSPLDTERTVEASERADDDRDSDAGDGDTFSPVGEVHHTVTFSADVTTIKPEEFTSEDPANSLCPISVAVRVRPFSPKEQAESSHCVVKVDGNTITLRDPSNATKQESFVFDYCFWSGEPRQRSVVTDIATQQVVFQQMGLQLIHNVLSGYNSCLMAYGQTGSGKTYTMLGEIGSSHSQGVIPRVCDELVRRVNDCPEGTTYRIEVSFIEVYNEKAHDLLSRASYVPDSARSTKSSARGSYKEGTPLPALKVREHPVRGPFVEGLSQHVVQSAEEIIFYVTKGMSERATACTKMSARSSRSHAVFTIMLHERTAVETPTAEGGEAFACMSSKLNLVDLAGSERATKSGIEDFGEMACINRSLTTLGRVIDTLVKHSRHTSKKIPCKCRPPYRESLLTWLLSDSIGGNSKTSIIATLSPADSNFSETLSTLRYAAKARKIVNQVMVNEDPSSALIRELQAEMQFLKRQVSTASSQLTQSEQAEVERLRGKLHLSERLVDELKDREHKEHLEWELRTAEQQLRLTHEQKERTRLQDQVSELSKALQEARQEHERKADMVTKFHQALLEKEAEARKRQAAEEALQRHLTQHEEETQEHLTQQNELQNRLHEREEALRQATAERSLIEASKSAIQARFQLEVANYMDKIVSLQHQHAQRESELRNELQSLRASHQTDINSWQARAEKLEAGVYTLSAAKLAAETAVHEKDETIQKLLARNKELEEELRAKAAAPQSDLRHPSASVALQEALNALGESTNRIEDASRTHREEVAQLLRGRIPVAEAGIENLMLHDALVALSAEYRRQLAGEWQRQPQFRALVQKLEEFVDGFGTRRSMGASFCGLGGSFGGRPAAGTMDTIVRRLLFQLLHASLRNEILESNLISVSTVVQKAISEKCTLTLQERQARSELNDLHGRFERALLVIRRMYLSENHVEPATET
eukprot:TRINITY_DN13225_c0_g1_i1.p1 TRINITY_DN13225_c0_g1~~TRINITY_DN13225_c0_g1_i1.p1  ORF type:complete len:1023 (-),score=192.77 TRINITY_DN13225_c0_g1_i1:52-3099(-)